MKLSKIVLVIVCMISSVYCQSTFDVMQFGALGDQKTDDSQAFLKAWEEACKASTPMVTLTIPKGKTFLLNSVDFRGPCKPTVFNLHVEGNVIAPNNLWGDGKGQWIAFGNINGLVVRGNGIFDGQGRVWWDHCPDVNAACTRPTALGFFGCNDLQVKDITSINSPRNHFSIKNCQNGNFTHVHLNAPEDSHNTDGFDISESSHIQILDTDVATGDDCVAINTGSSFIDIIRMTCGPGHGISVGSLGIDKTKPATAEEIHVKDSVIKATMNGVRIKTWQGAKGYARKITFENITFVGTSNPIIIDQYYCPHSKCENEPEAIKISDVSYIGVHGTSASEAAISLNCSKTMRCTSIELKHINITSSSPSKNVKAECINAYGSASDSNPPVDCLLSEKQFDVSRLVKSLSPSRLWDLVSSMFWV